MEKDKILELIQKFQQLKSEAHSPFYYAEKGKNKKERSDAERELSYIVDRAKFIIRENNIFELVYGENRAPQEYSEYFMTLRKYFKADIDEILEKLKELLSDDK